VVVHRVITYRILISHRYIRSAEYGRLAAMLDRAVIRDPTWRWEDLSVPVSQPIMSADEARVANVYETLMRERIRQVHAVLFIARDEWLDDVNSLYLELVQAPLMTNRPDVPIINVLPRGTDVDRSKHVLPSGVVVRWNARSIIRAIRTHAVPVCSSELVLTREEKAERARIVTTLSRHPRNTAGAARELGISDRTLRRERVKYLID
jgi:hypothetical protein